MGRQLRRWTRPCPASRGSPPLLLSRGPAVWAHIRESSRRAWPAGSAWVKGPDLLGQCRLIVYLRAESPVN